MNLDKLYAWFDGIELRLSNKQSAIAKDVVKEIRERLSFLLDVGLTYLTLNRPSKTFSGGEVSTHTAGNTNWFAIAGNYLYFG